MNDKAVIGNAELWHGDCRDVLPALDGVKAIISDPPYGISYVHNGKDKSGIGKGKYATRLNNMPIEGDSSPFDPSFLLSLSLPMILWGGNHFASRLPDSAAWFVWDKRAASGHSNDFADCEIAWTNIKGVARMFRHHWDGMMKASERGIERTHPTQKPVALMEWCIEKAGRPEVVCDPYMGTGATGVAAMNLGVKFVGVEIDRRYFDIACERIAHAQSQGVLLQVENSHCQHQQSLIADEKP